MAISWPLLLVIFSLNIFPTSLSHSLPPLLIIFHLSHLFFLLSSSFEPFSSTSSYPLLVKCRPGFPQPKCCPRSPPSPLGVGSTFAFHPRATFLCVLCA